MFNGFISDGERTIPLYDAPIEYQNATDKRTPLTSFLSKPTDLPLFQTNCFALPLHEAAHAWILVLRSDLDKLNLNNRYSLTFTSDSPVATSITWRNLVLCREPQAVIGAHTADDPDGVCLVELSDVRWLAKNPTFAQSINEQYNVQATADLSSGSTLYYEDSLNAGVAWTWAQMIGDVWATMAMLGTFPGIPFTPDGTPQGFTFQGIAAWDALTLLLQRIGCAVRADLTQAAGSQFTIVRVGAADSATAAIIAAAESRDRKIHDAEFQDLGILQPFGVRVFFLRDKTIAARNSTWETTNIYSVDVDGDVDGAEPGVYTPIWDDMPALDDGTDITNAAALATRAAERAADYFREIGANGGLLLWKRYSGLLAITTGSTFKGVRWVADHRGIWTETVRHSLVDAAPEKASRAGFTGCLSRIDACRGLTESEWYENGILVAVNAIPCPACTGSGSGSSGSSDCLCAETCYQTEISGLTNESCDYCSDLASVEMTGPYINVHPLTGQPFANTCFWISGGCEYSVVSTCFAICFVVLSVEYNGGDVTVVVQGRSSLDHSVTFEYSATLESWDCLSEIELDRVIPVGSGDDAAGTCSDYPATINVRPCSGSSVPTVDFTEDDLCTTATTITITGTDFVTPATDNTVVLKDSANNTIAHGALSGDSTSLTMTLTSPPIAALGAMTAQVTNANGDSGAVQVRTVVDCGGLVGWWKLSEGTGLVAYDSSGFGNDLTAGGVPGWNADTPGSQAGPGGCVQWASALPFLGGDPSLLPLGASARTVSFWHKHITPTHAKTSVYFQYGSVVTFQRLKGSGSIVFLDNNEDVTVALASAEDAWVFYTFTLDSDGRTWVFYSNGLPETNGTLAAAADDTSAGTIAIDGVNATGSVRMKDVRVYDYKLSAANVSSLYAGTFGP